MSQDNPVTPDSRLNAWWIQRLLSLADIRALRLQTIQRLFGAARRLNQKCCSGAGSRAPTFTQTTHLSCGLVTDDARGRVRQDSLCQLLDTGWLVWQPESVGYSWAEVVECEGMIALFHTDTNSSSHADNAAFRTLEQWETLGRNLARFRVQSQAAETEHDRASVLSREVAEGLPRSVKTNFHQRLTLQLRQSIISDLFQRNPEFTHVNLMIRHQLQDVWMSEPNPVDFERLGFCVERLRTRFVPSWQSGDMAIESFTTYTITRKDT